MVCPKESKVPVTSVFSNWEIEPSIPFWTLFKCSQASSSCLPSSWELRVSQLFENNV